MIDAMIIMIIMIIVIIMIIMITIWLRFAISARAVHLIALEPKVRSFGTLAVLVQTSPRCWDFGAQTKETTKATKARQMRSPQRRSTYAEHTQESAQIANKKG